MSNRCDLIKDKRPSVGHRVSHSNIKTKRRFKVNSHQIKVKSDLLSSTISLNLAVSTMRTIRKHGGLDAYMMSVKANKLTDLGLKLRRKIKKLSPASVAS